MGTGEFTKEDEHGNIYSRGWLLDPRNEASWIEARQPDGKLLFKIYFTGDAEEYFVTPWKEIVLHDRFENPVFSLQASRGDKAGEVELTLRRIYQA